jgi:AGCS family alanine or glycine:cation symporter
MYAFPSAFQNKYWPPLGKWLALLCALLLCIYGIEVYQFTVVVDTFVRCLAVENRNGVTFSLLALIIYVGMGGTKRLSNVCTVVMPVMILLYVGVCLWILLSHFSQLPHLLWLILRSAFCGHAPLGGFIGSTLLMAIQQGVAQGVYSSDIAVGFDSVLHSESRATDPRRQACVAIIASLTDTVMCTCSFVVVLLSDLWQEGAALSASDCILKAFEAHFKWGPHFLSIIIFLAGLTTIQAYFVVGLKSASYLNPKWGKSVYFVVGILNLWTFSHCQQSHVLTLMRLASGLLILVNLICLFRLRNQVYYDLDGVFKKMEEGPDRT